MPEYAVPDPVAWERLERDVVTRIRILAATTGPKFSGGPEIQQKIYNDVVLPNMRLLAAFCTNVQIDDGIPGLGEDGVRDPDCRCEDFRTGIPNGSCGGDGHYLCKECTERESQEDDHA